MNSAYVRMLRRERRITALWGILALTLLGAAVIVLLAAAVAAWGHFPTAWWLPPEARPFGGAL